MKLSSYLASLPAYSPKPVKYAVRFNVNESPYDLQADLKEKVMRELLKLNFNRYPNPRGSGAMQALQGYL